MYKNLLTKPIYAILDGDIVVAKIEGKDYNMPYLSGPYICDLSRKFGYYMQYSCSSRWMFMEVFIENNSILCSKLKFL